MLRNLFVAAAAATAITLLTPAPVDAWGAAHVGYTHVGPSGVYHAGRTTAVGPSGAYSTGRAGAYGYGGAGYHSSYGAAAAHHPYGTGYSGGYRYGGAAYAGGVYRRW